MNSCICDPHNIYWLSINMQFQIPLFFLLSGFFISKTNITNLKGLFSKFQLLVVPALIMMTLCCVVFSHGLRERYIFSRDHGGYWFTYALFEFIVLFEFIRHLCKLCKWNIKIEMILQLLVAIGCIYLSKLADLLVANNPTFYIFSLQEFNCYIYFAAGYYVSVYFSSVLKALQNPNVVGGVMIALILGNLFRYRFDFCNLSNYYKLLFYPIITGFGLFIIWKLFISFPQLSTTSRPGKFLTFVGQRTLDVYFIHYLILPRGIYNIGEYFTAHPSPVIEYLLATILGIIITIIALGIGQIIRLSPLTAKWMLGVKPSTR